MVCTDEKDCIPRIIGGLGARRQENKTKHVRRIDIRINRIILIEGWYTRFCVVLMNPVQRSCMYPDYVNRTLCRDTGSSVSSLPWPWVVDR